MRNLLPLSYFVLVIVLIGMIVSYFFASQDSLEWLKNISLNLGTEVVGIFLTVVLIDAAIRRNEAAERQRIKRIAFQQLRVSLVRQLNVLQGMYKATITNSPQNKPTTVSELFTDDYFVQLGLLDLSKPAPVVSVISIQWMDYIQSDVEKFKSAIGRTLEKYAVFLDVETVELLEDILASSFLHMMTQVPAIRDLDRKENFLRQYNLLAGQDMTELIRTYTGCFIKLVDVYNQNVPTDLQIKLDEGHWRDDIAPRFGTGRI